MPVVVDATWREESRRGLPETGIPGFLTLGGVVGKVFWVLILVCQALISSFLVENVSHRLVGYTARTRISVDVRADAGPDLRSLLLGLA